MIRDLPQESWDTVTESVALQHNSELKCALQLAVEVGETIDVIELRQRLVELTDGFKEAELPGSGEMAISFMDCMVPNRTFKAVSHKPLRIKKLSSPDQDALAGHYLKTSSDVNFGLTQGLGRTNIPEGKRRAPYFTLGILRELAWTNNKLNLPDLAYTLETPSSTILRRVQKLGGLGVILYTKVEKADHVPRPETSMPPRTAIQLAPSYAYIVRRLINATEAISQSDSVAIEEGIEVGQQIMNDPKRLANLLGKRLGG